MNEWIKAHFFVSLKNSNWAQGHSITLISFKNKILSLHLEQSSTSYKTLRQNKNKEMSQIYPHFILVALYKHSQPLSVFIFSEKNDENDFT